MGEKVYGHHAIEEALKKAPAGSTLYLMRGAQSLAGLERQAMLTGKVAVRKLSKNELEKMLPGRDVRGAILDLGGPRTGASRLKETTVQQFINGLAEDECALVIILDGITGSSVLPISSPRVWSSFPSGAASRPMRLS